jgi:hypothetical protein
LEFKVDESAATQAPAAAGAPKEKEKKKKTKDDASKKPPAPSALPLSDKPVTLNFKTGTTGSKPLVSLLGPKAPVSLPLGFSAEEFDPGDEEMESEPVAEDDKATAAKKVAPLIASKKTANNIQKWNQVQEELKEGPASVPRIQIEVSNTEATSVRPSISQASTSQSSAVSNGPSTALTPEPVEVEFEFSDTYAMTCLLCARQFKNMDQLKRHNKESDLHKKNFKDTNLRDVARQKAEGARKTSAFKAVEAEQPKYRDRASERRIMHNQPDIPLPENISAASKKKRYTEGPPPPPSPPPAPPAPGKDENNVGNKLLKMMGWKEGSGLGTDGDGRVDPIQTAIYAQGVGLGASKAKEFGKYAEGYSGYVHMAQDAARERYGS